MDVDIVDAIATVIVIVLIVILVIILFFVGGRHTMQRAQFWKFQEQSLKASNLLGEARRLLENYSYDLCVRMAQEAHELFAKTVLLLLGQEPPKDHDLSEALYDCADLLTQHGVTEERIARLALGSKTLAAWRELALYGDEKLRVARVFGEAEAALAVRYAEEMDSAHYAVQSALVAKLSS